MCIRDSSGHRASARSVVCAPSIPGMAKSTERALARRPDLRIITLSMFGEESYYSRMVQALSLIHIWRT